MSPATLPEALEPAVRHQPRARAVLAAALAAEPAHAYLLQGPQGSGKRASVRVLAAEILARGAEDPDSARQRAMTDPSPHPDLVWLVPPGNQHLVDDVRSLVIKGAAYRPFEGERRVFVIERAEAMAEESQNALLKTLEEPAPFAHFMLISSEPEALLETIRSRCQLVPFGPVPAPALEAELAELASGPELTAAARLARGDGERARWLLSEGGREVRERAQASARAVVAGEPEKAPIRELLAGAERAGADAAAEIESAIESDLAAMPPRSREAARLKRDGADLAKRRARQRRTAALDAGLELVGLWFRDLAVLDSGTEELIFNCDRLEELRVDAAAFESGRAAEAVRRTADARRRLALNVNEELAAEALLYTV